MPPEIAVPQFVKKVSSQKDKTIKYIFLAGREIIEFSYINKDDGKDIICAPTQTSCNLGCKFCFLSDYDLKVRNLLPQEIVIPMAHILKDLKLPAHGNPAKVLLVSFMGCGEPLLNLKNVIAAMETIRGYYAARYPVIRFAIATLIPHPSFLIQLTHAVSAKSLLVKLHLSLHSPDDEVRELLMPAAHPVAESIELVDKFRHATKNSAEIHYALIDGVNDRDEDLAELIRIFQGRDIPIKFLIYNEKLSLDLKESQRVAIFREKLAAYGIATEFYIPPGRDIGSSCGQFLMDYYMKYSGKKQK